jgi:branched-chain amino acid transport system substrate-binding protein
MEKLTKRILAIVLIAVVGVGIGVTVWIFVAPYPWGANDCPGAPANITPDQIIKIGVIGGINDIQGKAEWEGAWLAASEINTAGGITVGGKQYYFGVTNEDTTESNTNLDITTGNAAAQRIINYKQVQFLIGGFRSEAVLAYQEIIMDNKIPFISTGASTDIFTMNVRGFPAGDYPQFGVTGFPGSNYDRYKYFFRGMPPNSTTLAAQILPMLAGLRAIINGTLNFGHEMSPTHNITKIGVLREDLTWTAPFSAGLNAYLPGLGFEIVEEIAYPITATAASFTSYINTFNTSGTQILLPVISAQGGPLMVQAYSAIKPNFTIIGIDVHSMLDSYWDTTGGDCAYECFMQVSTRSNRTSKTIAMWDAYKAMWGDSPLYTAVGAYDAMYLYRWAINESQSLNADIIVSKLEELTRASPYEGSGAEIGFTDNHDLEAGWPYAQVLFVQWLPNGTKVITEHPLGLYPSTMIGTLPYQIIPWGINYGDLT